MADHTVTDFKIQNPQFQLGRMRKLAENVALFGSAQSANAGSTPAIDLRARRINGHHETTSQFKLPDNTISRRDPTADDPLTPAFIQDEEHVGIKINSTIGPYRDTIDKFIKRGNSEGAQSILIGEATGDYQFKDYATTGFAACIAALQGMAGTPLVLNFAGKLQQSALIQAKRLMGDMSSQLRSVVCNSGAYYDVMADSYAADKATVADIIVREGANPTLGMPSIVTDNMALDDGTYNPDGSVLAAATKNYTLLLVEGGITITESEDQARMYSQIELLRSNVFMNLQGEHAYNLDMKGMSWNIGSGGIAPSNVALATGANWDAYAPPKNCPGVLIISDV